MSVAKVFTKLTKRFIDARARRRKRKEVEEFIFVLESDEVLHASATKIQVAWREHIARQRWKQAISKARLLAVENEVDTDESDGVAGFMVAPSSEDSNESRDELEELAAIGRLQRQASATSVNKVTLDGFDEAKVNARAAELAKRERDVRRRRRKRKEGRKRRRKARDKARRRKAEESKAEEQQRLAEELRQGGRAPAEDALLPEEAVELADLEAAELEDDSETARWYAQPLRPEFVRDARLSAEAHPTVRRAVERIQGLVRVRRAQKELRRLRAARDAREVELRDEEAREYAESAVTVQRWFRSSSRRKRLRSLAAQARAKARAERRERMHELRRRKEEAERDEDTDPEEEQRRMEEFLSKTDALELDTIEVAFQCFARSHKKNGGGSGREIRNTQVGPFLSTIGQEPESAEELRIIVRDMDTRGRGSVSFEEFANWYRKRKTLFAPAALMNELFSMFDADRNGHINARELRAVMAKLKAPITEEEAYAMVQALDTDLDGEVSRGEFNAVAVHLL